MLGSTTKKEKKKQLAFNEKFSKNKNRGRMKARLKLITLKDDPLLPMGKTLTASFNAKLASMAQVVVMQRFLYGFG